MSKIKTIKLKNFKAIDSLEMDFNGCTAIVTAGNNKGKTSFLRGLPDRIRLVRPDIMVKNGAEEGHGELILDTGEKFIWDFDNKGKDKLIYVSSDNLKTPVTKALGAKFFPATFDIDKFLQSTPKEQTKQLQKAVGVDFTDVDRRYEEAYRERTARNEEAERFHVKLSKMLEVPKVDAVDLTELLSKKEAERTRLNELYKLNVAHNKKLREAHEYKVKEIGRAINDNRNVIQQMRGNLKHLTEAHEMLSKFGFTGAEKFVKDYESSIPEQVLMVFPVEPNYIAELPSDETLQAIDKQILEASEINTAAKAYYEYVSYKSQTEAAKQEAKMADEAVKKIEEERQAMILAAKFPKGITINEDGILVDGFPLDNNQISSSKKYTAALRIGAISLGEVKSLYFDASYLDRNSLAEIETWAAENDLQLLIERPDFDGGEIKYELIEA